MSTDLTKNTFSSTYKDDFLDSDNYHRILFNSGRALQARELTQMQTITQSEISRMGRHMFREGAAVNPGGTTINTAYEFIKLVGNLPTGNIIGLNLSSTSNSIIVEVLEAVERVSASEPATIYVKYVSSTGGTSGTTPVRVTAGDTLTGGGETLTVQTTNTVSNPATGVGTRVSIHAGDFFAVDRFVFAREQSMILSKYTSDPDAVIGFKVTQDIVTVDDTTALYDNTGATPNISSPGADRYRIRLDIADKAKLAADESFVYVAKVVDGLIVTQVDGTDSYNKIEDRMALRTSEESGNYIAKRFSVSFDTNDSDESILDFDISPGVAYVDGYRAVINSPVKIGVSKPRTTQTENNEVTAAAYGQYVIVSANKGLPNIASFQEVTLFPNTAGTGTAIGTARVRSIEEDGSNYRVYLFDVQIASGKNKRNTKSLGTGSTDYMTLVLENSLAAFKDEASTSLLFPVPGDRPKTITDISLTVQRYRTANISSGSATITVTNTGETFADTSNWIAAHADSDIDVLFTASGAGTAASNLTGQQDGTYEILTYVNKSAGSVRTKTLTEVTETITPDGSGNLNFTKADVSSITRITLADSDGADLTSSYTLDNGQRDFAYLNGRMVKKAGAATPGSDVFVRYDHFVHGTSGDFFAVNSYTGQVDYENIPSYTQANGTEVSLRNVLDFRSSVNSSGNFGSGARINEMPKNTGLITFDAEYYLGKKVRVTIDKNSFIDTISGAASVSPQLPPAPNNSLDLFHIDMNPYTVSDTDITSTTIKAKNFTMRDIGKLEERIDNVEEATSLSLLELDTSSFNVLDASGNNRTQSGFFVDNFADQARSYMSADYNAAIDPEARIMRPWFEENNLRLIYDSDQSSNTILKGDSVYLKHDNINYVDQPLATEAMNINPFAVILNEGFIDLSPSSDEWTAVDRLPDRVEDGGTRLVNNGALLWNTWRWNWIGRNDTTGRNLTARDTARNNILAVNRVVASETVREFVNDRILDVAFIPFMRSKKVFFRAQGLKPSTQVYAFFNNKPVADWVRSESFTRFATTTDDFGNRHNRATEHPDGKSTLTTGTDGSIEGSFFIPNTDAIKFRTGTREFKLLDISVPNDENATSIAKEPFASTGILETRQSTFTTTRVLTIAAPPPPVQPRRRRRRSTQDFVRSFAPQADPRNQRRRDPLAQTFFIDENDGAFITRVGVRFQTKDTTVPVMLQIRSTVNGVPSADEVIPNGVKVLSPSDVTESADASLVTYFEFDEPVYLNGNMEYSIVLLADSIEYNVYVAKAGDLMLNSTELRVAKQPTLGSLFKSQNSRTWTPDQERDLTFTIDRANFTVESGYVTLNNAPIPPILLASNPLDSTNSSATVKVLAFGHGLVVGDSVTIAGAATFGGIAASNINGTRAVTKVDGTGFEFVAGNSDTANQAVAGGGDNITVTRNIMMDTVVPYIETLSPAQTLISHSAKFTSGKSFAGSETAYSVDGSYQSISNRDNNTFANPRLIASSENETASLSGNKSLTYKIDVSTSTDIVAPVIDLQRASVTAVRNLVDQQVASGTGGNIPLEYVAETNPTGGSHLSKHITSPVVLDESAVGLKIMIGANRPSAASFDVYYRTNASDTAAAGNLLDSTWVLATLETEIPSDQNINVFREYRYLVGGDGGTMDAFSQFQVKIVLKSTNTSTPPVIQDLRIIALSV